MVKLRSVRFDVPFMCPSDSACEPSLEPNYDVWIRCKPFSGYPDRVAWATSGRQQRGQVVVCAIISSDLQIKLGIYHSVDTVALLPLSDHRINPPNHLALLHGYIDATLSDFSLVVPSSPFIT
jgi:hypothetical protein